MNRRWALALGILLGAVTAPSPVSAVPTVEITGGAIYSAYDIDFYVTVRGIDFVMDGPMEFGGLWPFDRSGQRLIFELAWVGGLWQGEDFIASDVLSDLDTPIPPTILEFTHEDLAYPAPYGMSLATSTPFTMTGVLYDQAGRFSLNLTGQGTIHAETCDPDTGPDCWSGFRWWYAFGPQTQVPEPSTLPLLALGLGILTVRRWASP